ncbi:MAG: hypothetical protein ACRDBG_06340, partial [Waterburya sp.]
EVMLQFQTNQPLEVGARKFFPSGGAAVKIMKGDQGFFGLISYKEHPDAPIVFATGGLPPQLVNKSTIKQLLSNYECQFAKLQMEHLCFTAEVTIQADSKKAKFENLGEVLPQVFLKKTSTSKLSLNGGVASFGVGKQVTHSYLYMGRVVDSISIQKSRITFMDKNWELKSLLNYLRGVVLDRQVVRTEKNRLLPIVTEQNFPLLAYLVEQICQIAGKELNFSEEMLAEIQTMLPKTEESVESSPPPSIPKTVYLPKIIVNLPTTPDVGIKLPKV